VVQLWFRDAGKQKCALLPEGKVLIKNLVITPFIGALASLRAQLTSSHHLEPR
jgi:hypothetical protein